MDLDDLDLARLRATRGEKWRIYPPDVLPLWVADMDFPVADPIRELLRETYERSDVGYPVHPTLGRLPTLFAARALERFGWDLDPARVEVITDVVQGMYVGLLTLTAEGAGTVVQTPVYPPFLGCVTDVGRRMITNELVDDGSGYAIDFDGLRADLDPDAGAIMFCNPQNPTGRVFARDELEQLGQIAIERDLVIISDEIHADLVFPPHEHIPMATLGPEVEVRTITLYSATKAFNIAGLRCSVAAFGSASLQKRFQSLPRHALGGIGTLGLAATELAWTRGQPWLDEVLACLDRNRCFVADFLREELPGVRHHSPEATYLAWLDCRALELRREPYEFFLDEAKVALGRGRSFGQGGEGFVRLNFATSRSILSEALERMAKAVRSHGR
ncbi:MAG: MalY/PatB family protein [Myxococcota bacterium]